MFEATKAQLSMLKDCRGQGGIAALGGVAVAALIVTVVIVIWGDVYSNLNKTNISAGAQNLISLTPLVLAAGTIVGILGAAFYFTRFR